MKTVLKLMFTSGQRHFLKGKAEYPLNKEHECLAWRICAIGIMMPVIVGVILTIEDCLGLSFGAGILGMILLFLGAFMALQGGLVACLSADARNYPQEIREGNEQSQFPLSERPDGDSYRWN